MWYGCASIPHRRSFDAEDRYWRFGWSALSVAWKRKENQNVRVYEGLFVVTKVIVLSAGEYKLHTHHLQDVGAALPPLTKCHHLQYGYFSVELAVVPNRTAFGQFDRR